MQRELDISVVPILLTVDGKEIADDALAPHELLAAGTLSTAAPSAGCVHPAPCASARIPTACWC